MLSPFKNYLYKNNITLNGNPDEKQIRIRLNELNIQSILTERKKHLFNEQVLTKWNHPFG